MGAPKCNSISIKFWRRAPGPGVITFTVIFMIWPPSVAGQFGAGSAPGAGNLTPKISASKL